MSGALLPLVQLVGATCALIPSNVVETQSADVRVADIATLDCLEPDVRATIADRRVATIPPERTEIALSRAALANLAIRTVPGLVGLEVGENEGTVRLRNGARVPVSVSPAPCFIASRHVRAGTTLDATAVAEGPCQEDAIIAQLEFDRRHGALRAARDVSPGDYLGRLMVLPAPFPDAGDDIVLSAPIGNVLVERRVHAMQPAPGQRLFVQADDGEIFAIDRANTEDRQ